MKSPLIIIVSTLVTGFAGGVIYNQYFDYPETDETPTTQSIDAQATDKGYPNQTEASNIATDLKILQQRLEDEVTLRKSLQTQIDRLSLQVAELDQNLQLSDRVDAGEEINPDEQPDTVGSTSVWFDEKALIDSGMTTSQAAELKTFFEQQELDRMYLRDQSIREQWDRQRYLDEIQKIAEQSEGFLDQLDEAAYDAYLYASQQPNRVKVTNVLDSSQASAAGIQPGDNIIRYDNERIYSGFELRTATTAGNIDESVAVEIERDGEILELYLARGPLGIRMDSVSVAPDS